MIAQVHEEYVTRKYYRSRLSCAYIFSVVCTAVVVALPFFIGYNSHSFWIKENTYREQPKAVYQYKVLLFAEGIMMDGSDEHPSSIFWSTLPASLNSFVESNLRPAEIRSVVADNNRDGVMDSVNLQVSVPLHPTEKIYSVSALVFFEYELRERAKIKTDTLTYISYSSGIPGRAFHVDGDMDLVVKSPLTVKGGQRNLYADSPLLDYQSVKGAGDLKFIKIIKNYRSRNVTTNFVHDYAQWTRDLGSASTTNPSFVFNATIRFPEVDVIYTPEASEVLKTAWIQYYALFVLVYFFINTIKSFLYQQKLVEAVIITDSKSNINTPSWRHDKAA